MATERAPGVVVCAWCDISETTEDDVVFDERARAWFHAGRCLDEYREAMADMMFDSAIKEERDE